MKISKNQIIQLSVVSIFIGLLSLNALFDGATERMIIVQNAVVETLKFMMHYVSAALEIIAPLARFFFLGLVMVYVLMLFLSFRSGRHS